MSHLDSTQQRKMNVDEVEDAGTFQQQALEIQLPGANFDPNATPTTGEEFLTLMAYERKHIPAVCVSQCPEGSNNNNVNTACTATIKNDAEFAARERKNTTHSYDLFPSDEWKVIQINNFESTRDNINKMRALFPPNTEVMVPADGDSSAWLNFCRQNPPKLSIIFNIGQRSLEHLLETFSEWLRWGEKPFEKVETTTNNNITSGTTEMPAATVAVSPSNTPTTTTTATASTQTTTDQVAEMVMEMIDENLMKELNLISQWLGQWLYATLACLHLPLEPSVHSTLREIARICIRQRGRLSMPEEAKNVLVYNIFIYLIAKYFRQLDFSEFV